MIRWLKEFLSDDFSFRSEAGVKINVRHGSNGMPRASVDFSDSQTKEIMREKMQKWAQYEIKDGRLVKKEDK